MFTKFLLDAMLLIIGAAIGLVVAIVALAYAVFYKYK
jgi:hypothetical protein